MSRTNNSFERARSPVHLKNGTAGEWFNNVRGKQFKCSCDKSFEVKQKHIGLSSGENLPDTIDVLKSKLLGEPLGGDDYNVSDNIVANGLFTSDSALVQGYIKCPYCIEHHWHHTDYVQSQGECFQPPNPKNIKIIGD